MAEDTAFRGLTWAIEAVAHAHRIVIHGLHYPRPAEIHLHPRPSNRPWLEIEMFWHGEGTGIVFRLDFPAGFCDYRRKIRQLAHWMEHTARNLEVTHARPAEGGDQGAH